MTEITPLLPQIEQLATTLSASQAQTLAIALSRGDGMGWHDRRYTLLDLPLPPEAHRLLTDLLATWEELDHPPSPSLVAAALQGASFTFHAQQKRHSIELVWTGPEPAMARLRRTEQALLELIRTAQTRILVVSFAVYRADRIMAELLTALERGVQVQICVEAPEPSGQRMAYDTLAALGDDLASRATLYIWPQERRSADDRGRQGSLHAKCAVADEHLLFLSSANLTGYAMNLNMELGVLIRGGLLPGQVSAYFQRLIALDILRPVVR